MIVSVINIDCVNHQITICADGILHIVYGVTPHSPNSVKGYLKYIDSGADIETKNDVLLTFSADGRTAEIVEILEKEQIKHRDPGLITPEQAV